MKITKLHIFFIQMTIAIFFLATFLAKAQENINIQVKVYDLELNPIENVSLTVDQAPAFTTNSSGIAFTLLPENSLPPKSVEVSDNELEVESWNYSKGILEIILRKKSYRQVMISIIDSNKKPVSGVKVAVNAIVLQSFVTDRLGKNSIKLPLSIELDKRGLFEINGYDIAQRRISDDNIIIVVNEIRDKAPVVINDQAILALDSDDDVLKDLDIDNLDSIASLTVLYSLMKKVNYIQLDTTSKIQLDKKFNELMRQDLQSTLASRKAIDLISDSTIIDQDILVVVDKIKLEEQLLNDAREEFRRFINQIETKLTEGGQNLDLEERKQLIQLVLNLKEMLRQNEELFYKNNEFYKDEVDGLLGQLANIHELEDLLSQSKKTYSETKEQLVYAIFGFASIIGLTMLLVMLVKTLKNQRIQLTHANEEISRINSNLEGIVAEKTESLELINNELDTFLYRSSHNLKRPLTSIRGLASIAEITLDSEAISLFEKVVLTTNEMEKMLDKLTMMNHINQPVNFGVLDLKAISDKLRSQFSSLIEAGNINFNISIQDDVKFSSFPIVVETMLANILENALFFCQYNQDRKPEVSLSFTQDSRKKLQISVHDNGCGIKPQVQEKLWDMFFIGNELSKGSGLGLFISKKAIEALHGTVKIETVVGTYSDFKITLPVMKKSKRNIKPVNS